MGRAWRKHLRADQFLARPDAGQRIEPVGDRLAEHQYVGRDAEMLDRTQLTGAIDAHLDFIDHQQNAVLDKYGILLVVDEIQMGVYRTGKLWSIEHFGVTPDILVFGKAITNGLNPLSGIWAREELISPGVFPPGSTHSTFASNPTGTAVALETVKMLEEQDYELLTTEKGAYLLAGLRDLKSRYKIIGDVDGMGLALRIEV